MGFPQVASYNGGYDTGGTDHTVNLPSGIQSGDLLVVLFGSDGGSETITFPNEGTDWIKLFLISDSEGAITFGVWYRIADGNEGSTIQVTGGSNESTAHLSYRINAYSGTPEFAYADGNDKYPDPPNLSPTWGTKDTLWIAGCCHDDGNDIIAAFPTNYTDGHQYYYASSGGEGVGGAQRELNASSENPGSFTIDNIEQWVAVTLAVSPITTNYVNIAGTTGATSGLSGLSKVMRSIGGLISGISGMVGLSKVNRNIAGQIDSVSNLSGLIKVYRNIAGVVSATSSLIGNLVTGVFVDIAGAIQATSSLIGAVKRDIKIVGSTMATSTVSGTVKLYKHLIGSVSAISSMIGAIKRDMGLSGTIGAQSTISGTIKSYFHLIGSTMAQSTVSGLAKVYRNIVGSISATSSLIGSLVTGIIVDLAGAISATSNLVGSIKREMNIAGTIVAQSSINGIIKVYRNIVGSVSAVSNLIGTISIGGITIKIFDTLRHIIVPPPMGRLRWIRTAFGWKAKIER